MRSVALLVLGLLLAGCGDLDDTVCIGGGMDGGGCGDGGCDPGCDPPDGGGNA